MAHLHNVERFTTPPDLPDIEALAREAMALIPEELRRWKSGVTVRVADFPQEDLVDEMGLETPFDLLGFYQATIPLDGENKQGGQRVEKTTNSDTGDAVYLFRRPILDYWCETGEDLRDIVRNVLIHEIGHHFGFSDDEMEKIERGVSPR